MPRKPADNDSSQFPYLGRDALSPTSTGLILRIKDGESAAWERFVALYTPLIRYWCRKPGGVLTRPDRQEIAQEVLVKVAKAIGDFDEKRKDRSFRAWLRKITQNVIINKLDDIQSRLPVSRLASDTGHFVYEKLPAKSFEIPDEPEKEKSIVLRQVLKIVGPEFSQRDWEIVDLFVNAGQTSSEVAEAMDMKPDTVRRIKNRILARIRQEYPEPDWDGELPNSR